MTIISFRRLNNSLGVVNDTKYINCYWPSLDEPTELFADGSNGIVVMGRPTPRNVIFPDDTIFESYYPDALYPAEQAVLREFPSVKQMVNLTQEQTDVYVSAYNNEVSKFPPTHTVFETTHDVFFLKHNIEKETGGVEGKDFSEPSILIAPISKQDAITVAKGDDSTYDGFISLDKVLFYSASDSDLNTAKKYQLIKIDGRYVIQEKPSVIVGDIN